MNPSHAGRRHCSATGTAVAAATLRFLRFTRRPFCAQRALRPDLAAAAGSGPLGTGLLPQPNRPAGAFGHPDALQLFRYQRALSAPAHPPGAAGRALSGLHTGISYPPPHPTHPHTHPLSQVDCYSLGVVLWELVAREQAVRGNLRHFTDDECAPAIATLIDDLLQVDPTRRPSPAEVVARLRAAVARPALIDSPTANTPRGKCSN